MARNIRSFSLSPDLLEKISKIAEQRGVSSSRLVEEALRDYFDRAQGVIENKDVHAAIKEVTNLNNSKMSVGASDQKISGAGLIALGTALLVGLNYLQKNRE